MPHGVLCVRWTQAQPRPQPLLRPLPLQGGLAPHAPLQRSRRTCARACFRCTMHTCRLTGAPSGTARCGATPRFGPMSTRPWNCSGCVRAVKRLPCGVSVRGRQLQGRGSAPPACLRQRHQQHAPALVPRQVDLSPLGRDELVAFALNAYNALIIHALVVHGPDKYSSPVSRKAFFAKVGCPRAGARRTALCAAVHWLMAAKPLRRATGHPAPHPRPRATPLGVWSTRRTTWRTACSAATAPAPRRWVCCWACPALARGPLVGPTRGAGPWWMAPLTRASTLRSCAAPRAAPPSSCTVPPTWTRALARRQTPSALATLR